MWFLCLFSRLHGRSSCNLTLQSTWREATMQNQTTTKRRKKKLTNQELKRSKRVYLHCRWTLDYQKKKCYHSRVQLTGCKTAKHSIWTSFCESLVVFLPFLTCTIGSFARLKSLSSCWLISHRPTSAPHPCTFIFTYFCLTQLPAMMLL